MALLVGIDEAGYGPLLGPLVVGASVWRVADEHVRDCLWTRLSACVTRSPERGDWRLHVDDSKRVYDRARGLSSLERPILAVCRAAGFSAETLGELIAASAGPGDAPRERRMPWYAELDRPLPLAREVGDVSAVSSRLARVMSESQAECRRLLAEVVTEDRFNERVRATRNKAAVLLEHVLRLMHRAAGSDPGEPRVVFRVDRLGGRVRYLPALQQAFPERAAQVLEESDERCRYRLSGPRDEWFVEFAVDGDRDQLPVALASMFAKYLREGVMASFNEYWRRHQPEVAPTAGYYTDARRFLSDIAATAARVGPDPGAFTRMR